MADIARLGLVVEASGVDQAKGQLQQLATTGQLAGQQLVYLAQSSGGASSGFQRMESAAHSGHVTFRTVSTTLSEMAIATNMLGPSAGIAVHAFMALGSVVSPLTIGFAALAAVTALTTRRIDQAKESLAHLDEMNLQNIQKEIGNLKTEQTVKAQIQVLQALDPQLETIRQKYELMAVSAKKTGASETELTAITRLSALEQNKLLDARSLAIQQADEALRGEVITRQYELAMIGQNAVTQAAYNLALKEQALQMRLLKGENADYINQLVEIARQESAISNTRRQIANGAQAFGQTQASTGITTELSAMTGFEQLTTVFAATFNQFKTNPKMQAMLQEAFATLIQQGITYGVPDIPELISSKIGSMNFERLRATLSGPLDELKAKMDATMQPGQQWGAVWDAMQVDATRAFVNIGRELDQFGYRIDAIVNQVIAELNSLPNIERTINYRVTFSESPARPFSEFLPTMTQRFSGLQDLVKNMTPDIEMQIPNFRQNLVSIQDMYDRVRAAGYYASQSFFSAARAQQDQAGQAQGPYTSIYAWMQPKDIQRILPNLQAQYADMVNALLNRANQAMGRSTVSSSAGASAASAGGGETIVNINLQGANLTPDYLDNELMPIIERAILRATGKSPSETRVLS